MYFLERTKRNNLSQYTVSFFWFMTSEENSGVALWIEIANSHFTDLLPLK